MKNVIKQEFTTAPHISTTKKSAAAAFVVQAKKIARGMATNYNQKKKAYESAATSYHTSGALDISRIHS